MGAQRARKGPGPHLVAALASGFVLVGGVAVVAWLVEVRGSGFAVELAGPRAVDLAITGLGILALSAVAHACVATAVGRMQVGGANGLLRRALDIDVTDPDEVRQFDSVPELRELVVSLVTEKAHVRDLSDRMETLRGEVDAAMEGMRRSARDLRRLREEGGSALGMEIAVLWNGLVERVRGAEERSARAEQHVSQGSSAVPVSPDLETLVNRLDELESDLARLRTAIGTPPSGEVLQPAVSLGWQAAPGAPNELFVEEDFEVQPQPPARPQLQPQPHAQPHAQSRPQPTQSKPLAREFLLAEEDESPREYNLEPLTPSDSEFPRSGDLRADLRMEEMPFPRFVEQPKAPSGDRVQVTYQGPAMDGVIDLPSSALLFEPEAGGQPQAGSRQEKDRDDTSDTSHDERVFDLRSFGAREFES